MRPRRHHEAVADPTKNCTASHYRVLSSGQEGDLIAELEGLGRSKIIFDNKGTLTYRVSQLGMGTTIEKPLEMPYQNLLCLRRICLFVYVCSVTKPNFIPRSLMGS